MTNHQTAEVGKLIADMASAAFGTGRLHADWTGYDEHEHGSLYVFDRSCDKNVVVKVLIALRTDGFDVGFVKPSDRRTKGVFPVHKKRGTPIPDRSFAYDGYDSKTVDSYRRTLVNIARGFGSQEVYVEPDDTTELSEALRTAIESGDSYDAAEIIAKAVAEAAPGSVDDVAEAIRSAIAGMAPR